MDLVSRIPAGRDKFNHVANSFRGIPLFKCYCDLVVYAEIISKTTIYSQPGGFVIRHLPCFQAAAGRIDFFFSLVLFNPLRAVDLFHATCI